jgi:hypothetical protein
MLCVWMLDVVLLCWSIFILSYDCSLPAGTRRPLVPVHVGRQERPGMGSHELNSGSFTRDWRRANATVHSLLRQHTESSTEKAHARKIDDQVECNG